MDTQGLSQICAGLGEQIEDDNGALIGYSKSEHCLDNLKDLQRFLRRDNPQRRDVFKQICRWNTVGKDLVPIIEFNQNDRHLVINAVKILVFLSMPVDNTSDDVAQQIEYLWDLKAAVTRNVTIAIIVSLLEDPLEDLESNSFTEDDWKLVQLVLTLFRNILSIQDLTLQQKASGFATQYLYLTDKFLEIVFQENVMDLILVLTQHVDDPRGYLHKDSLLLLDIYHHIFHGRDPELVARCFEKGAKADGDIVTSVESLKSIMEEEEERKRSIRQRNLERHSQFSGTFTRLTVDGSKRLVKRNPTSGDNLLKVQKVPKGPLKRIVWDHGSLMFPKENILELLHNFMNQFLSGGYNALMQSIRNDITSEHQDIQTVDVILFFQVAQFVTAFQCQKVSIMQKQNMQDSPAEASLNRGIVDDFCGAIAETINEAMFFLVISKWREAFEGLKTTNDHKSLSAAGSLIKTMIHMLDLVLKLLPEDSKEPQTARILLYKLFYDQTDQGLTLFLLNLFRCFDTHRQPKSDLADLLEIIHVILRLMEKLQARGTLRVAKKLRKVKKAKKGGDEAGSDLKKDESSSLQNDVDQTNEIEKSTSDSVLNESNTSHNLSDSSPAKKEDTSTSNQAMEPDKPLDDNLPHNDNLPHRDGGNKINLNEQAYETEDSSDGDNLPATNEVDFNVTKLVLSFANNAVIHNLCWLLKYYKSNSARTNHYIICMLRRFCDDLELSPMLYQLSLLTTFYDILSDKKTSNSKDFANIIHFITKILRKLMKTLKSQPLLFVEILFWKTRKECHNINADALMGDLAHLKKDIESLNKERTGFSNSSRAGYKSIADSLGDDEVDNVLPHIYNRQGDEKLSDDMEENKSEGKSSNLRTQTTSRARKSFLFDPEQEATIRELYEIHKDDRHCSRLIAEVLDDELYSPVQISCKLRQMGLKLAPRKRLKTSGVHFTDTENAADVALDPSSASNEPNASSNLKTSRKRISAVSKEQELEIKELFERFKDHKKCSQLIANAISVDNTYTAAQVSRKLRQLGLLNSRAKKSAKPSNGNEKIESVDCSDGETLRVIKERSKREKNRPLMQEAVTVSISQHYTDDETLGTMFKSKRKKSGSLVQEATAVNTSQHDTDDETLGTMFKSKRKKSRSLVQEAATINTSQHDTNDETLGTMFKSKRKKSRSLMQEVATVDTSQHDTNDETLGTMFKDALKQKQDSDVAAFVDNSEIDMGSIEDVNANISHQQDDKTDDALKEDLEDSEDDLVIAIPRNIGSRRNVKMVIDADDDE